MVELSASGGKLVRHIGNGAGNTLKITGIKVDKTENYQLTIAYTATEARTALMRINDGNGKTLKFPASDSGSAISTIKIHVILKAGLNFLEFSNAKNASPDIDLITIGR